MTSSSMTHVPTKLNQASSIKIYLGLIAGLIIIYGLFTRMPTNYIVPLLGAPSVWYEIIGLAVLGLGGVWLSQKTGFPAMWDNHISSKQRFLTPALVGLALGAILVLFNQTVLHLPASLHVPFPASIFYYTFASLETEILFRLIPIPLLVWLISMVLRNGRGSEIAFWGVALVLSLGEPLMQLGGLQHMGLIDAMESWVISLLFVLIYSSNLASAYFFRRAGFLAPLTMRFALYLAWHIIFGGLG